MRNEQAFVGKCLDSLLLQIRGRDHAEILCVDGASTDRTREIIQEYAEREPSVVLVDNPEKIVPCAMNRGIRQARGNVIIRCDCHCEYAPDYIEKSVEVLERTGAQNVGGYCTTRPGIDSPVGRAIAAAVTSRFGVGNSVFRTGGDEQEVDTLAFGCFPREIFDQYGLYDERLVRNQDNELNARIRRGGGKIIVSPEIKVTYYSRSTYAGLRQLAFNHGLWNVYTIWILGGGLRIRHFVPLAFVLSLMLLAVAGFWWPIAWYALGLEAFTYAAMGFAMAVRAGGETPAPAFLVFWAFVQFHMSYGVGSLWGIVTAPAKFGIGRAHGPGKVLADRRD